MPDVGTKRKIPESRCSISIFKNQNDDIMNTERKEEPNANMECKIARNESF